jgi:hypothetical protein
VPVEDPEKEDGATPTSTPSAVLRVAEPEAKPMPVPMAPDGGLVRKFASLLVGGHGSVRGRINKRGSILGRLSLRLSADVKWPAPISASSAMRPRTTRSRRARACPRRRRSSGTCRRHRPRTAARRRSSGFTTAALRKLCRPRRRRKNPRARSGAARARMAVAAERAARRRRAARVAGIFAAGRRDCAKVPSTAGASVPAWRRWRSGVATVDGWRRRSHVMPALLHASV